MITLTYSPITEENLKEATAFQNQLFPDHDAYQNYYESVKGFRDASYFLAYYYDEIVGITGIYNEPCDKKSAWLGWIGVKEGYRRLHIGTGLLRYFEYLALQRGYSFARLYADGGDAIAKAFYENQGYVAERYECPDDPASKEAGIIIYSKPLGTTPCPAWDNKNIHLAEQAEKEKSRQAQENK